MTGSAVTSWHAWRSAVAALLACLVVGAVTGAAGGAGLDRLVQTLIRHPVT